jgi:hypothetical protein
MDAWRKSDVAGEAQIIDALVRRRAAEKAAYLADCQIVSAPSAFVRAKLDHAADILGVPAASMPAPDVGAVLPAPHKPEPAARIAEILKSEPATEALLLTQVVNEDFADEGAAHQLVTAHAKPKARAIEETGEMTPAGRKRGLGYSFEQLGLCALFVFGAALLAFGASTLFSGRGDVIDWVSAAALATPGLAAMAMAAFGFWKGPAQSRA